MLLKIILESLLLFSNSWQDSWILCWKSWQSGCYWDAN